MGLPVVDGIVGTPGAALDGGRLDGGTVAEDTGAFVPGEETTLDDELGSLAATVGGLTVCWVGKTSDVEALAEGEVDAVVGGPSLAARLVVGLLAPDVDEVDPSTDSGEFVVVDAGSVVALSPVAAASSSIMSPGSNLLSSMTARGAIADSPRVVVDVEAEVNGPATSVVSTSTPSDPDKMEFVVRATTKVNASMIEARRALKRVLPPTAAAG